ncbi:DegV family protein [Vermiculatibacterium agrestimuris]|uniref:DegV family protein n=1 Tax=Vermiculatibacterium agrestimuris TaxID=2941519 RepID=UPI00203A880C|nr:DegV family protein [Vermiculatibacterium agrestimuris]
MIRIFSDSTCEFSLQRQKELDVEVVPLSVHFGQESFRDGIDLTNEAFYARLRTAQELPHTSQTNPEEFVERFKPYVEQGDEIIGVFLSSQLSGTCQSAVIAAQILGTDRVHIIDSTTVTFGLGLLVEMAARLRDEHKTAREIVSGLEALIPRLRLYAVVETLKYLRMGGRISAATAMVGGVLGVTPILNVRDGVVEAAGKSRGRKGGYQWMAKRIEAEPVDTSLPVAFAHTGAPELMAECEAFFKPLIPGMDIREGAIGSVVGTHAGPGATGIAYFVKE